GATNMFAAQPRIAVLDLFTDENSIRAQSAATNFTALLEVELSKDFQLVERAQMAAAERELHLSAMNRGSVASGLRIGKWANAAREKQTTISVVYARPGNLALTDDLIRQFTSLPLVLEKKVATNPAVRVVRLPEARTAASESSLILSGLVEADPEAVTQVAD